MKSTGIVRCVDELGRIVIPKEIRTVFEIADGSEKIEFFVEGDKLILAKYQPKCIFCGAESTVNFNEKKICKQCIEAISKL